MHGESWLLLKQIPNQSTSLPVAADARTTILLALRQSFVVQVMITEVDASALIKRVSKYVNLTDSRGSAG